MSASEGPRPRRQTRAEKKAETRARLLEAAARIFPREGYHGATIEQIAEEAGFSHGALYSNFASKEEVFLALADEYARARVQETAAAHGDDRPFREQAREAAELWMERVLTDPAVVILRLEFALHAARHSELRESFARRERAMTELLESLIAQERRSSGRDSPLSARDLALAVRGIGIGLAIEALVDPDIVRPDLYGDVVSLLHEALERT